MSVLASTFEISTHPAIALILGGIIAAVLRGRFASFALILTPLFGLGHVATLDIGASSTLNLFGMKF